MTETVEVPVDDLKRVLEFVATEKTSEPQRVPDYVDDSAIKLEEIVHEDD